MSSGLHGHRRAVLLLRRLQAELVPRDRVLPLVRQPGLAGVHRDQAGSRKRMPTDGQTDRKTKFAITDSQQCERFMLSSA